eukprot:TRINITY_DN8394_c0_g1_i1.p1 TRINITY_DN8394_c0_g1~~TRINITY_DN8394_c0_g1_i1.p1  ORF type:complete len:175 (+),score=13.80 TRINITY_DN8394_c0_g1_i1:282-806(+)
MCWLRQVFDSVEVLDSVSGAWSTVAPLPTPRCCHQCAVVGRFVYVVGGISDGPDEEDVDSVEVLDTASGTWSTAAPLPAPRSRHQCAVVGRLVYVLGGCSDGREQGVVVLDTMSGIWSQLGHGARLPLEVPTLPNEQLCEYKEQPSVRGVARCPHLAIGRLPVGQQRMLGNDSS